MNTTTEQPATSDEIAMPGTELFRYFSLKKCGLISVRSTGSTYLKTMLHDWRLLALKKDEHTLEQWQRRKTTEFKASLHVWQLGVGELPSMEELGEWVSDGVCESLTGHSTEPDGYGPDGAPSWLLALRMI